MVKPRQKLFYKIGEVCTRCEIEPHVLRYWETVFTRLKPVKNRAGQRIYRRNDLELIEKIKFLLYEKGYTIAGANTELMAEGYGNREEMPLFEDSKKLNQRQAIKKIKQELDAIEKLLTDSEE